MDAPQDPPAEAVGVEAPALRRPARAPSLRKRPARVLRTVAGRAFLALTSALPFRACYCAGGLLGAAAFALPGRTRRVTRINLRMCFPELGASERDAIGRRSAASSARFALEIGGIWCRSRERVLGLIREVHGLEHVEAAFARGMGLIAITPHLGSWELAGLWASTCWPTTSLYKPPRAGDLEPYYRARRERFGARLAPASPSGVASLLRALSRNELVAILPDQDPGRGSGILVPFFGVPANTSVLIPRLIQRTGAAAVLAACVRLPRGRGFAMHIEPASERLAEPDVESATRALNADLERLVRRFRDQYLWAYKRFRVRPPGVPSRYA
jgi:KDO2-lipid IV(A) lauroyltransferase